MRYAGFASTFHPGVRADAEVDEHLARIGLACQSRITFGAGPDLTLSEFLNRIQSGEFSYLWNVPDAVQTECMRQLRDWASTTFDLDTPIQIPSEMYWTIYRRPAT